ncbi:MAG TPA: hypothetical protein VIH16_06265 [Bellilinea sp.]
MARYSFEIGATQGGMVNLESLATPIIPPDWKFAEYSDEIPLPNGKVRGVGYPLATWHWGYLEKAERTALRTFCTGKSAEVYIKTLVNDSLAYKTFRAVMVWPAGEDPTCDIYPDFTIEFRHLIEVV